MNIVEQKSDARDPNVQTRSGPGTSPLIGPAKWSYFYLYVILDIFSRRVVGWCVADAKSATLFQPLPDDTIGKHNVPPGQLTPHADHGGPMKAKATAFLLADLGVTLA
jgi:putative transposase